MVALTDRLDRVIGAKSAGPLEEHFGIRTVDDLLRHYPRKYSDGMSVLGEGEEPPEEGEHVTFVDVIAEGRGPLDATGQPKREYPRRHARATDRPKVTATFFNAKFTQEDLVEGTRLMLSGEVGFFNGHNAVDASGVPDPRRAERQGKGSKSLAKIAETSETTGGRAAVGVRAGLLPDLPGQRQGAELGHLRVRASGARRARPGRRSAAGIVLQQWNLMSEDEALRAIHLAETRGGPRAAPARLAFDEAVGLQWALVERTARRTERDRSRRRQPRTTDWPDRACAAAAVRADRGPARRARRAVGRTGGNQADAPDAAG